MVSISCKFCGKNAIQDAFSFKILWWVSNNQVHQPCIVCCDSCMNSVNALHQKDHPKGCRLIVTLPKSSTGSKAPALYDSVASKSSWSPEARTALRNILSVTRFIQSEGQVVSLDTPGSLTVLAPTERSVR